ncbi:MAG: T9SS type A sorting domain-containing protein [Chitinophagaceae bacterium]|nr:T9SS type A sorting domain-containing protein [Chitinophagaceae bacterium]
MFFTILTCNRHTKTDILFSVYMVLCVTCFGQQQYNLVPNYSFEQYTTCPNGATLNEHLRNSKPDYWYKPDKRGAAYLNACATSGLLGVPENGIGGGSYQLARTGQAYISMFYYNGGNNRNYFQVELLDSLRQGKCYYAQFYASLVNTNPIGCNNQSMLFTVTPIYVDTLSGDLLPANPQIQNPYIITDTLNWIKVSGVFTAQGGEKYLTLGNFKNNTETATQQIQLSNPYAAIYYIEYVSVLPLDSITIKADAGIDKTITQGDSVFIGSYTTGLTNVTWYNSTGNAIATNTAGFYVQPTTSTFYVIEQNVCGQYSKDTVYITVGVVPLTITGFTLAPLSRGEGLGVRWATLNETNVAHFNIQRSNNGIEFNTIQQTTAKNNAYNEYSITDVQPLNGVSYYRIEAVDKDGKTTYSKTEKVQIKIENEQLTIFPNPTTNIVNIAFKEMQQIIITDVTGRLLLSKQLGCVNNTQLNISTIGKGIFFVRAIGKDGSSETKKLLVQ